MNKKRISQENACDVNKTGQQGNQETSGQGMPEGNTHNSRTVKHDSTSSSSSSSSSFPASQLFADAKDGGKIKAHESDSSKFFDSESEGIDHEDDDFGDEDDKSAVNSNYDSDNGIVFADDDIETEDKLHKDPSKTDSYNRNDSGYYGNASVGAREPSSPEKIVTGNEKKKADDELLEILRGCIPDLNGAHEEIIYDSKNDKYWDKEESMLVKRFITSDGVELVMRRRSASVKNREAIKAIKEDIREQSLLFELHSDELDQFATEKLESSLLSSELNPAMFDSADSSVAIHHLSQEGKECIVKPVAYELRREGDEYISTLYMPDGGISAKEALKEEPHSAKPVATLKSWLLDLAQGLVYLESKQVMHRDIKPENLLINRTTGRLSIIDFGFAWRVKNGKFPTDDKGTGQYAAPEVRSKQKQGFRADAYAAGSTFRELMMGMDVFGFKTMAEFLKLDRKKPYPLNEKYENDRDAILIRDLIQQMVDPEEGNRPPAKDIVKLMARPSG